MNTSHNGFRNFATWIVFRDMFSNMNPSRIIGECSKPSIAVLAGAFSMFARDQVFETSEEGFARECALQYLESVNFYEIASVMHENYYLNESDQNGYWVKGTDDDDEAYEYIPSPEELS
jgi:hypothetical protein